MSQRTFLKSWRIFDGMTNFLTSLHTFRRPWRNDVFLMSRHFLTSWRTIRRHAELVDVKINYLTLWRTFWRHDVYLTSWRTFLKSLGHFYLRHDVFLTSWCNFDVVTNCWTYWRIFEIMTNYLKSWHIWLFCLHSLLLLSILYNWDWHDCCFLLQLHMCYDTCGL